MCYLNPAGIGGASRDNQGIILHIFSKVICLADSNPTELLAIHGAM